MQKQMAILQLMMSQQVSGSTALSMMGLDWGDEQQRLGEEARKQQEIQARIQEEMEQAGFAQQIAKGQTGGPMAPTAAQGAGGGAPPAGGAPVGPGGTPEQAMMAGSGPVTGYLDSLGQNAQTTPEDMMAEADSMAQQLLGLPESIKDSELRKLKQANPVLHSLVRQRMDSIRQEARTQGGAAMMQQQFGSPGATA
jgi:hypothetical protein